MAITITVRNLQRRIPLNPTPIIRIAQKILRHEGILQGELSLAFVSGSRMRSLNKKFLKKDYVTDVLAFNFQERPFSVRPARSVYGEIIIAPAVALQNAQRFQNTLRREITLYVVHGILHLLGYDDHVPTDIKRMRLRENEILRYLSL